VPALLSDSNGAGKNDVKIIIP